MTTSFAFIFRGENRSSQSKCLYHAECGAAWRSSAGGAPSGGAPRGQISCSISLIEELTYFCPPVILLVYHNLVPTMPTTTRTPQQCYVPTTTTTITRTDDQGFLPTGTNHRHRRASPVSEDAPLTSGSNSSHQRHFRRTHLLLVPTAPSSVSEDAPLTTAGTRRSFANIKTDPTNQSVV